MKFSVPERFTTNRLILQRLRYEDAEEIFYAYAGKPEATRFVSWPTHRTIKDTQAYLAHANSAWGTTDFSFSIRLGENSRLLGSFGFLQDKGKIQFGYILSPSQWGNGFATEACRRMLPVMTSMPDVERLWTFADSENTASIRVLRKLGMREEGVIMNWHRFINQNNKPKDCTFFVWSQDGGATQGTYP
jgi:[ribosomal protein S5]-alanine N-acetyltransferase